MITSKRLGYLLFKETITSAMNMQLLLFDYLKLMEFFSRNMGLHLHYAKSLTFTSTSIIHKLEWIFKCLHPTFYIVLYIFYLITLLKQSYPLSRQFVQPQIKTLR